MKTCTRCGIEKAVDDYHRHPNTRDKHQAYCKVCAITASRAYYRANADKLRAAARRWRKEHLEDLAAYDRARSQLPHRKEQQKAVARRWRKNNPDRALALDLRKKFGLSMAEYEALLAAQNGVCAICGATPGKKRLGVDHDHDSGAIRGLLCSGCNTGIGLLGDSPRVLLASIRYLASPPALAVELVKRENAERKAP